MTKNLIKKLALIALVMGFGTDAVMATDSEAPKTKRRGRRSLTGRTNLSNKADRRKTRVRKNRSVFGASASAAATTLAAEAEEIAKIKNKIEENQQTIKTLTENINSVSQKLVASGNKATELNSEIEKLQNAIQVLQKENKDAAEAMESKPAMTEEEFEDFLDKKLVNQLGAQKSRRMLESFVKATKKNKDLIMKYGVAHVYDTVAFRLELEDDQLKELERIIEKNKKPEENEDEKNTMASLVDSTELVQYMTNEINNFMFDKKSNRNSKKWTPKKIQDKMQNRANGKGVTFKAFLKGFAAEWDSMTHEKSADGVQPKNPFQDNGAFSRKVRDIVNFGRPISDSGVTTQALKTPLHEQNDVRKALGLPEAADMIKAMEEKLKSGVEKGKKQAQETTENIKKTWDKINGEVKSIQELTSNQRVEKLFIYAQRLFDLGVKRVNSYDSNVPQDVKNFLRFYDKDSVQGKTEWSSISSVQNIYERTLREASIVDKPVTSGRSLENIVKKIVEHMETVRNGIRKQESDMMMSGKVLNKQALENVVQETEEKFKRKVDQEIKDFCVLKGDPQSVYNFDTIYPQYLEQVGRSAAYAGISQKKSELKKDFIEKIQSWNKKVESVLGESQVFNPKGIISASNVANLVEPQLKDFQQEFEYQIARSQDEQEQITRAIIEKQKAMGEELKVNQQKYVQLRQEQNQKSQEISNRLGQIVVEMGKKLSSNELPTFKAEVLQLIGEKEILSSQQIQELDERLKKVNPEGNAPSAQLAKLMPEFQLKLTEFEGIINTLNNRLTNEKSATDKKVADVTDKLEILKGMLQDKKDIRQEVLRVVNGLRKYMENISDLEKDILIKEKKIQELESNQNQKDIGALDQLRNENLELKRNIEKNKQGAILSGELTNRVGRLEAMSDKIVAGQLSDQVQQRDVIAMLKELVALAKQAGDVSKQPIDVSIEGVPAGQSGEILAKVDITMRTLLERMRMMGIQGEGEQQFAEMRGHPQIHISRENQPRFYDEGEQSFDAENDESDDAVDHLNVPPLSGKWSLKNLPKKSFQGGRIEHGVNKDVKLYFGPISNQEGDNHSLLSLPDQSSFIDDKEIALDIRGKGGEAHPQKQLSFVVPDQKGQSSKKIESVESVLQSMNKPGELEKIMQEWEDFLEQKGVEESTILSSVQLVQDSIGYFRDKNQSLSPLSAAVNFLDMMQSIMGVADNDLGGTLKQFSGFTKVEQWKKILGQQDGN